MKTYIIAGVRADIAAELERQPLLLPLPRVSGLLGGTSQRTLRRWIHQGRLQALRTSRRGSARLLIPRGEVLRLLNEMLIQAEP